MGYHANYSWVQSHGSKPLAINPVGNNVGVGTANPQAKLDVAGSVKCTDVITPSDSRFKMDIEPITGVLKNLQKIRGVYFRWNGLSQSLGYAHQRKDIGLIAEEVETVYPELVGAWGEENYKGLNYGKVAVVLIEAIKELHAELEILERRIMVDR